MEERKTFDHRRLALLLRHRHPLTLRLIDVFPDGVDHRSEPFVLSSPFHCDLTLADLLPPEAEAGGFAGNDLTATGLHIGAREMARYARAIVSAVAAAEDYSVREAEFITASGAAAGSASAVRAEREFERLVRDGRLEISGGREIKKKESPRGNDGGGGAAVRKIGGKESEEGENDKANNDDDDDDNDDGDEEEEEEEEEEDEEDIPEEIAGDDDDDDDRTLSDDGEPPGAVTSTPSADFRRTVRAGLSDDDLVLFDESYADGSPLSASHDNQSGGDGGDDPLAATAAARALVNQLSQALALAAHRAAASATTGDHHHKRNQTQPQSNINSNDNSGAGNGQQAGAPPNAVYDRTGAADPYVSHPHDGRRGRDPVTGSLGPDSTSSSSSSSSLGFPDGSYLDMQREVDAIASSLCALDDDNDDLFGSGFHPRSHKSNSQLDPSDLSDPSYQRGQSNTSGTNGDGGYGSKSNGTGTGRDQNPAVHYTDVSGVRRTVRLGRFLGRGSFGDVRLGTVEETGELVAVKRLCALGSGGMGGKSMETLLGIEVSLLRQFNHPCVVSYRGLAADSAQGDFNIILEYVGGGSLQSALDARNGRPFTDDEATSVVRDILEGLVYLHGMGVIHRDLKPANVLLRGDNGVPGDGSGRLRAVLTDFGVSTQLAQLHSIRRSCVGTPGYAAPEVLDPERDYNRLCDIYSLGSLAYALVTGRRPWHGFDPIGAMLKTVRGERPPFPKNVSRGAKRFVQRCWGTSPPSSLQVHTAAVSGENNTSLNPNQGIVRPEAAELLDDDWVMRREEPQPTATKIRRVKVKRKVKVRG